MREFNETHIPGSEPDFGADRTGGAGPDFPDHEFPGHEFPGRGSFPGRGAFPGRGGPFGPFPSPRGPFAHGGPGAPFGPGRGRPRGRRGQVRSAILALLAEGPSNGYQIMQSLSERTGGAWRPSPGTVYPALSQLEDEGLIVRHEEDGQKSFELTDDGRAAAEKLEHLPWDLINQRVADHGGAGIRNLWEEYGALGGALKELSRSGSPEQFVEAASLLESTKRGIYRLLAEPSPAADADTAD